MKIKEFLQTKLNNFEIFMKEQIDKIQLSENNKNKLLGELSFFKNEPTAFISVFGQLPNDTDKAIKKYCLNYNIEIDKIKDKIDYDKLKRYLEMFKETIQTLK